MKNYRECVIALQFEDGNTKAVILSEERPLLFAEAEEPKLAADQIRDFVRGRDLEIRAISIKVARKGMAKAVESVLLRLAQAL